MSNIVKNILGSVTVVALCIVIFLEVRCFFNIYSRNLNDDTDMLIAIAAEIGSDVSITQLTSQDEAPMPDADGEVFKVKNYDINIKVNGILTTTEPDFYGNYSYTKINTEDTTSIPVKVEVISGGYETYKQSYAAYVNGDTSGMLQMLSTGDTSDFECYQQSFQDYVVPIVYNKSTGSYTLYADTADECFIKITCSEPIALTKEIPTIHYSDPAKNIMSEHVYSKYEEWAAEQTLKDLLEDKGSNKKDDVNDSRKPTIDNNPYASGNAAGENGTYMSAANKDIRNSVVNYANIKWNEKGEAEGSDTKLDLTSDEALKSEWKITQTVYNYTSNGLSIINISATLSATAFDMTVNLINNVDAEREYVMLVKYLDSNHNLIAVKVIDKRNNPIKAKGADTFSVKLDSVTDKCKVDDVNFVQFEVY